MDDLAGQSRRTASTLLAELNVQRSVAYDDLVALMALAWISGFQAGNPTEAATLAFVTAYHAVKSERAA